MSHYMYEFLGLMAVFSIMIVSPGADFAIVVRQSIVHGRRSAIMTSYRHWHLHCFSTLATLCSGLVLLVSKSG